jgi:low temperature requirement protein LtrA
VFAAIWWAWMYTTWAANWLDPSALPVRIVLLLVMLGEPADGGRAAARVRRRAGCSPVAYVAIQVCRTLFLPGAEPARARAAQHAARRAVVRRLGGVLDRRRAAADGGQRSLVARSRWRSNTPGRSRCSTCPFLGRSTVREWTISGHHMAERCRAVHHHRARRRRSWSPARTFAGQR